MITFLKINIEGFCSFSGNTSIDLNPKHTILIKAPNGSGKSTIFSALSWVCYGKTLKGSSQVSTWSEVKPKNYQGTKVELFFSNQNNVVFKVIRCQNYKGLLDDGSKGGDRLLVFKEAYPIDIKGKLNIQKYLENEIGMSYKLFTNSIMFGEDVQRLISETNTDKKKLFEEAFSLNFLNLAKNIAVEERSEVYDEVVSDTNELESLKKSYRLTKESYKDVKEGERNFNKLLNDNLDKLKANRTSLTKKLIKCKENYSEDKQHLVEVKLKRYRKSLEYIKIKLAKARELSNIPLIDVINQVIKLLEHGNSDKALKKVKNIKRAFEDIEELSRSRDELNDGIYKLNDKLSSLKSVKRDCDNLAREIADVDEEIFELKNKDIKKSNSEAYKIKAKKLKKAYQKIELGLKPKKDKLSNYDWLLSDPLSNKGIKAFLFDSCLSMLNETLDGYSPILGFRIQFEIDLNSTKKDFITMIERDNHIIEYGELSRGEKQLCDVAMAFAMNESLTASKGVNIALLDEIFEHLDDSNIELVIGLINQVYEDKSLFLITHQSSLPLSNVKTMQVIKEHGQSTVKIL